MKFKLFCIPQVRRSTSNLHWMISSQVLLCVINSNCSCQIETCLIHCIRIKDELLKFYVHMDGCLLCCKTNKLNKSTLQENYFEKHHKHPKHCISLGFEGFQQIILSASLIMLFRYKPQNSRSKYMYLQNLHLVSTTILQSAL